MTGAGGSPAPAEFHSPTFVSETALFDLRALRFLRRAMLGPLRGRDGGTGTAPCAGLRGSLSQGCAWAEGTGRPRWVSLAPGQHGRGTAGVLREHFRGVGPRSDSCSRNRI